MNDKYMDDFEKAWEEMHGMSIRDGGGGGGPGAGGGRGLPVSGSALAAQQRGIYAALEEPSSSYGSGYGAGPAASAGSFGGCVRARGARGGTSVGVGGRAGRGGSHPWDGVYQI